MSYMLGWILIAAAKVEVHTPNMDALIDEGILLERLLGRSGARLGAARSSVRSVCLRHYTYKICSPTRSSIQSGRLAAAGPQEHSWNTTTARFVSSKLSPCAGACESRQLGSHLPELR